MLVLTRREGESILISPSDSADFNMTLSELFADGPIAVCVNDVKGKTVRLSLDVPQALLILREELNETQ